MHRSSTLFLCLVFLIVVGCKCQRDVTNFKLGSQAIHPLSIREILPTMAGGKEESCKPFGSINTPIEERQETVLANKGNWFRSAIDPTGFIDYVILGEYKKCTAILVREADGTLNRAYVLFVKYDCNKICRKRSMEVTDLVNKLVRLEQSNLIVGNDRFPIDTLPQ